MRHRLLPKTGWEISEISYGCMSLKEDKRTNTRLLQKAIGLGINFFDTADIYHQGENEKTLGQALKPYRQQIYLATKVGNQKRPDGSGWDWNPTREYILKAVKLSLKRLKTDYIDLYQLHGGTLQDPIDEIIEAFEILKQQGHIRHYGISSIRPNVIREYLTRSNLVSVMMQYSLLDRRPEEACLQQIKRQKVGVMVRGAVAKGLLIDKKATKYLNYPPKQVSLAAAGINKLSGDHRSPGQTALQFVFRSPSVTTIVAGMRTYTQLVDNVAASGNVSLTDREFKYLQSLIPINRYEDHR